MPDTENSIQNKGIPEFTMTLSVAETVQAPVDATLTIAGKAADAKATGKKFDDLDSEISELSESNDAKVAKPVDDPNGTAGQLLRTNGDGTTEWSFVGTPTDEQTETAVSEWLTNHPEATTTVEDGVISRVKLNADLQGKTDAVPVLQSNVSDNGLAVPAENWISGKRAVIIPQLDTSAFGDENANSNWRYAKITCSPGDVFTITATGTEQYLPWGFGTAEDECCGKSNSASCTNEIVIAPANAAYIIINQNADRGACYIGGLVGHRLSEMDASFDAVNAELEQIRQNGYTETAIDDFTVEIGSIENGASVASTKRARTNGHILVSGYDAVMVACDSSVEYRVLLYNELSAAGFDRYVNEYGTDAGIIPIENHKSIRLVFRPKYTAIALDDNFISLVQSTTNITGLNNRFVESANLESVKADIQGNAAEIEKTNEHIYRNMAPTFEIGGMNGSGVAETINLSQNRARSSTFGYTGGCMNAPYVESDDTVQYRIAYYTIGTSDAFEGYANTWASGKTELPGDKYFKVLARYASGENIASISDFSAHITVSVEQDYSQINTSRLSPLSGKRVAILGDSISTNGTFSGGDNADYRNIPEVIIQSEDVGQAIKGYLTSPDFTFYTESGDGWHSKDESNYYLNVGGNVYSLPISGEDSVTGTEITVTPTEDDIGKWFGTPANKNTAGMMVWWELAAKELGFTPINACYSGSCISRAREGGVDDDGHMDQNGSYAWSESQVRRCGTRIPGTNSRIAPDAIIIYRGTNDFNTARNGKYTPVDTSVFEGTGFFNFTDDLVGTAPARSGRDETDLPLYGYVQAYILTIQRLRKAYPYAKIFLCTLNIFGRVHYKNGFPVNNGESTLPQWNNAIRAIADYMGCGIIEFDKSGITKENYLGYVTDGEGQAPTHPNDKGQYILAQKAIADIRSQYGSMDVDSALKAYQRGDTKYVWNGTFSE